MFVGFCLYKEEIQRGEPHQSSVEGAARMPRNVLDCPLPIKPASERDISLAEGGDRMAKARLAMNKSRTKQREKEIAKWEEANGPAPWRENPDLLSDAGPVTRPTGLSSRRESQVCFSGSSEFLSCLSLMTLRVWRGT